MRSKWRKGGACVGAVVFAGISCAAWEAMVARAGEYAAIVGVNALLFGYTALLLLASAWSLPVDWYTELVALMLATTSAAEARARVDRIFKWALIGTAVVCTINVMSAWATAWDDDAHHSRVVDFILDGVKSNPFVRAGYLVALSFIMLPWIGSAALVIGALLAFGARVKATLRTLEPFTILARHTEICHDLSRAMRILQPMFILICLLKLVTIAMFSVALVVIEDYSSNDLTVALYSCSSAEEHAAVDRALLRIRSRRFGFRLCGLLITPVALIEALSVYVSVFVVMLNIRQGSE
ncbi:uncharacterized protein AMSG_01476 [Thecamonas trahens ATCC 50062]|uniref:Uncharacterized protein n=1 Tax=Thecamonas trahens ATCC 50062 TaxID=461836 RepID=A0A0L0DQR5_THETB|nr:hypothetical protein AMSG_01476 [Thecamonas trahens ATCC 50062]KNC54622.1 hypothetical protein AMSG_01476 [Thecamonas trahens ATCC 50062]|eukprot:XP_013761529.1 hypothetical protein AMSG_01476 [Thecamonas trahens ATCC 50062]